MDVNRIDQKFAALRASGAKAFIAYICAGDPTLEATRQLALGLERAGVDILELGVPFSDPLADGIVNQLASQRALQAGTTPYGVLDCVRQIRRESQVPIVLYTYLNPLLALGFEKFHRDAADAGVDGLLILDLPPDEDAPELANTGNIRRIRLIAPTTPDDRIAQIAAGADGFIYYVSREGVTGEQSSVADTVASRVEAIRRATDLPIAVGFGVSNPDQARQVAHLADGVVVGSAIVKRIAQFAGQPGMPDLVAEFVRPMAAAVKF
ncbi:MAG TPA: tryptophan synthase subunit alpha [Chthoniobacteraceae bacterium]|jgi:tryptophan synthase alpha chain|nr:tryptophan synthase subunit alpha [Chthoniobacteraceae bacterium]